MSFDEPQMKPMPPDPLRGREPTLTPDCACVGAMVESAVRQVAPRRARKARRMICSLNTDDRRGDCTMPLAGRDNTRNGPRREERTNAGNVARRPWRHRRVEAEGPPIVYRAPEFTMTGDHDLH